MFLALTLSLGTRRTVPLCELVVRIVPVAIPIAGHASLFAVLIGFVVLLPLLEQAMMSRAVMLVNFVRVVCGTGSFPAPGMRYFSQPLTCFVAVLVGLMMYRALLNPFVVLVLSHRRSPC